MSDANNTPQLPPGTPQINVNLADSFGGQKIEQIHVDSNRSIRGERREKWQAVLDLPARWADMFLQAFSTVAASAFLTSITRFIPSINALIPIYAMVLILALTVAVVAWRYYPELRMLLVYWGCLVFIGGSLGVFL